MWKSIGIILLLETTSKESRWGQQAILAVFQMDSLKGLAFASVDQSSQLQYLMSITVRPSVLLYKSSSSSAVLSAVSFAQAGFLLGPPSPASSMPLRSPLRSLANVVAVREPLLSNTCNLVLSSLTEDIWALWFRFFGTWWTKQCQHYGEKPHTGDVVTVEVIISNCKHSQAHGEIWYSSIFIEEHPASQQRRQRISNG
jgi:hypothetical protein